MEESADDERTRAVFISRCALVPALEVGARRRRRGTRLETASALGTGSSPYRLVAETRIWRRFT